jgi:type II secretory pathway predicted ATPase ExeA
MAETELAAVLARKLGGWTEEAAIEAGAWRALRHAVRICRIQGSAVILAVDECDAEQGPLDGILRGLMHLGGELGQVSILVAQCEGDAAPDRDVGLRSWSLAIRLAPLTFSEAERYVRERLASAGCPDTLFAPRAMARLHLLSGGTPRGLNRLASLSLIAAAARRLEAVPSELVDDVSRECRMWAGFTSPA